MIDNPWETESDSFYFVNSVLVMHNKAMYDYSPLNDWLLSVVSNWYNLLSVNK